ncbi:MAG: hypothetical protein PHX62_04445 [Bacilli bacterium]|nr:hypothetical protein [Bacilli bacterium]
MKRSREIVIVLSTSIITTGIMVILLYLDPNPNEEHQILSYIFLSLWSFSFIPCFVYVYRWINSKSFEQGMRLGVIFQSGLIVIPLLIAPYLMVKYYISLFSKDNS